MKIETNSSNFQNQPETQLLRIQPTNIDMKAVFATERLLFILE
jgi:hypothetical protein